MHQHFFVSKIGLFLVSLLLLLCSGTYSAFAEGEMAGDGTQQNPYVVMNEEQFVSLANQPQPIGYVRLGSDLDMSRLDSQAFPTSTAVIPKLTGTFDGGGHTIKNLTLKGGKGGYNYTDGTTVYVDVGLIGELSGTVRDLKIIGISISDAIGNYNNVGTIAGRVADASAVVENCIVTGSISCNGGGGAQTFIGGLVGMVSGSKDAPSSLTVQRCVSGISITAKSNAKGYGGGILGSAQYYSNVTVDKCAILGAETDGTRIGTSDMSGANCGVIGYINSASVSLTLADSYLGAKVSGSNKFGIAYNISALSSLSVTGFHYDSTANPSLSVYNSFKMLNKGDVSVTANTTEEILQPLSIDGFEVREDEFGKYPVPVWQSVTPVPQYENAIRFSGDAAFVSAKQAGTYTVIFAAYRDDQLISASVVTKAFAAGENQEVKVPSDFHPEGADAASAMLLHSLTDLVPLTDAAPYQP